MLDNVRAHKPRAMRHNIDQTGASLIFLPAYSPDMNFIELSWSGNEGRPKDFGARTVDDLHQAIRSAMDLVCADAAAGWFKHCGYRPPAK